MLIWEKSKGNSRSEPDLLADTTTIKKKKKKNHLAWINSAQLKWMKVSNERRVSSPEQPSNRSNT